jgi:Zn finger protein HypA/HybF involved in hydrogenase expression
MNEWINDGIWYCDQCEITFKVYVESDEPDVSFCPSCASREIEVVEEDE